MLRKTKSKKYKSGGIRNSKKIKYLPIEITHNMIHKGGMEVSNFTDEENKDNIKSHNNNIFRILTHNVGGQTIKTLSGEKVHLSTPHRGTFRNGDEYLNSYGVNPTSIYEDVDVVCFQEYPGLHKESGPRTSNLFILDKNNNYQDESVVTKRILEYISPYTINGEKIHIVNFHGKIISDSSSTAQIEDCLGLLQKLIELYHTSHNLIILGDFNFELNNDKYINEAHQNMINTKKKGPTREVIINNAETIKNQLIEYCHFFRDNFVIIQSNEATNTWSLNESPVDTFKSPPPPIQTSVDQCIISNKFKGIKHLRWSVLDKYMATEIRPVTFLVNDFDHAALLVEIEFETPYN